MRESTVHHLAVGATEFLEERGLICASVKQSYQQLVRLQNQDREDKFRSAPLVHLQRQLLSRSEQAALKRGRRQRIHNLVRQLKYRKHMSSLRDSAGVVHNSPKKVAALVKEYWSGVMSRGGGGGGGLWPVPPQLAGANQTEDSFATTNEAANTRGGDGGVRRAQGGILGRGDGMPAELYQQLPSISVPRMEAAMGEFLNKGRVPDAWTVSLMKCIPKFAQASQARDMRPIALQNRAMKWLSAVVLVQLREVFAQIIPASQKGFMRGRHMVEHVVSARMEWEARPEQVLVAVDFQKAYDSVSFPFLRVALGYIGLAAPYVSVLLMAVALSGS